MPTPTTAGFDPLRPTSLADFDGQPDVTRQLQTVLGAARARGEMADHILLHGNPGLGKTTLAVIIAHELDKPLQTATASSVQNPGDLAALLVGLPAGGSVVFLDEIHGLEPKAEEQLYSAMEDRRIDYLIGKGATAKTMAVPLPPFTLVGATTRGGRISVPLRDRFGLVARLRPYPVDTLARIVARNAVKLEVDLDEAGALAIAERALGTPRLANFRLRRVRDWAQMHHTGPVGGQEAAAALATFGIDESGLDRLARELLSYLALAGRPVGLNALATGVGEAPSTVEQMYEPDLVQMGLLVRTPQGRAHTDAGRAHLGMPADAGVEQPTLPM